MVNKSQIYLRLKSRYPKAEIHLLDNVYELPESREVKSYYKAFQRAMWKFKLTKWLKNKLDCDKWARMFTSYVTLKNAQTENKNGFPVGLLCYPINGNIFNSHAINVCVVKTKAGIAIKELEPQPRQRFVELNDKEREGAWLIVI